MTRKPRKTRKPKRRVKAGRAAPGKVTSDRMVREILIQHAEEPVSPVGGDAKSASQPVQTRQMVLAAIAVGLIVIAGMTYFFLRSR